MLNDFADDVIRKSVKIKPDETILTKFCYPKLAVINGRRCITVLDIDSKEEDGLCPRDSYHETETDITDVFLQGQLLWLLVEQGQLIILDLFSGLILPVVTDSYRYQKFKTDGKKLYLISNNEVCLLVASTVSDILSKLNTSEKEIDVKVLKVRNVPRLHTQVHENCKLVDNKRGVLLEIDRGALIIKCPLTGLKAMAAGARDCEWTHVVSWGEMAVLSDGTGIWVVQLKNTDIWLKLNEEAASYIPLAAQMDCFYYLKSSMDEVQIHCVHKANTIEDETLNTTANNDIQKLRVQKFLKEQIEQMVVSIVSNGLSVPETSTQLQTFVNEIDDVEYLLSKVTTLCNHDIQYKFLLKSLLVKAQNDVSIVEKLGELMSRIDIIEYILIELKTYNTADVFQSNMIDLCINFICNSDLTLASFAWVKLLRFSGELTPSNIIDILNATPYNIKMNSFILWLKNFIPSVLEQNPFHVDLFVKWITERVFSFEKSPYWPKIGLKFIEEIVLVLQSALCANSNTKSNLVITITPTAMDSLDILKDHISTILELKEKYKINMLLGELSSLGPAEIALIKLQRCYTEDLAIFLRDYLLPFTSENLLELDNIMKIHVESETLNNGGGVDDTRLKIILEAFRTNNTKFQCLLDVLRTLEVPWADPMRELAVSSVKILDKEFMMCDADLQLIHDIKMEIHYANLKVVLKKYNFPLDINNYMLVLNKVANAQNVNLYDLKIIMQSMSGYSHYGSIIYIDRCLQDCSVKRALDYFKGLSEIERKILIKSVVIKYEFIVNDTTNNSIMERNYLDFIKGTHLLNSVRTSQIEDMYHLKNSYNIKVTLNEMSHETVRVEKITQWFLTTGERSSTGRGVCVTRLARLPHSFITTLIELLSHTSASIEVQTLVESLVTMFTKSKNDYEDMESLMTHFKDSKNSSELWNCCEIIIHLIHKCPEEYLHLLVKVLTIMSAIVNTSINVKTIAWKFHYVFVPMSNISSSDDLISLYVDIISQRDLNEDYLNKLTVKSDIVPLRMISMYTYTCISSNTYLNNVIEMKKKIAKRIISNILLSQECDELLLASSLLLLNSTIEPEDRFKPDWLWNVLEGYGDSTPTAMSKYLSSSMMRRALGMDNSLLSNPVTMAPHYMLQTKYNLNVADLALPDITEDTWDAKIVLYYVLRTYPNTSLDTLVGFCQTLNVDVDDGLSLQLISHLVGWELKYEMYTDAWGCPQMKYENDETELYRKCSVIWNSIKNKTFLTDVLTDFWKKGEVSLQGRLVSINPYYYEIHMCVYKLFESRPEWLKLNEYHLLHFLKDYKRISSPKQYEFELFSVKGIFPEIGHYRLPFQLFMRENLWSNLKSEITLATYEQWLPIVALLHLDTDLQIARDMLCSNALKQTMTATKLNNNINIDEKHKEPWRLQAKEEPLLRAAHRCVRHIANKEWAGACLFYVLQGCARGADQVAAVQLCYNFAQRWSSIQPVNRAVQQMKMLYRAYSTRHALHKIDWASEDLLKFEAEPSQLIQAIYFHPNLLKKITRYNVNRAIDNIADKNNVNISSVRIQILENILEQKYVEKKNISANVGLSNEELMRAKYILKATCPKMGAMYLARIALEDETDFNKNKKLRALQCLISMVEPDTAVKVTNKERESLWSSLVDLYFAIRLEEVDMPWAVPTFSKDKVRTLDQVCSASENSNEGLQLAAELTARYGYEQHIRILLPRLISTSLFDILANLLCKRFIYPDKLICSAWRAVLLSPFLQADYPITDRQRYRCLKVINILPIFFSLTDDDLNIIWKNCIRIKCYSIACLILPFMSATARELLTELKKIDKRKLIAGLKNLQTDSYLINGALSVIENSASRKLR